MAGYVKGDIVLAPFPLSGEESFKARPALVMAVLAYERSNDYLLCIITTQKPNDTHLLPLDSTDIQGGRLTNNVTCAPLTPIRFLKISSSGGWGVLRMRNFNSQFNFWYQCLPHEPT